VHRKYVNPIWQTMAKAKSTSETRYTATPERKAFHRASVTPDFESAISRVFLQRKSGSEVCVWTANSFSTAA
jgi:hypothetical protein